MRIGYVCTNYNNSSYTRTAMRSLLGSDAHVYSVVIVDNHSDDENVQALRQLACEFNEVDVILNDENVGYFRGLNVGIRHLRSKRPEVELMVVGNNDLVFPDNFCASIQKNLSIFQEHAVVSPDIVTMDGVHQNPHVICGISKLREVVYDLYYFNYYLAIAIRKAAKVTEAFTDRPDERHHQVAQRIHQGHGACYLLGPLFFRHFAELWAPSFLMHEEYFLSKQLSDRGLHVYYEPSIMVMHQCHAAINKMPGKALWKAARDAHKIYRQHVKLFG